MISGANRTTNLRMPLPRNRSSARPVAASDKAMMPVNRTPDAI
jgi:hypothetical protein